MSSSDNGWNLQGTLMAPAARRWVDANRTAERPAPSIHSMHRNAVNLVDGQQRLLSLVLQELGPGPFALVLRADSPEFQAAGGFEAALGPHVPVTVEENRLTVGPLLVDFAGAASWNPRPSWGAVDAEMLRGRLPELRQLLVRHAPAGSFAPLAEPGGEVPLGAEPDGEVPLGAEPGGEVPLGAEPDGEVPLGAEPGGEVPLGAEPYGQAPADPSAGVAAKALAAAAEPARLLMEGLRRRNSAALGGAAELLAGLGGGVTPSGDDYLLGAILALWTLVQPEEAGQLAQTITERAAPRTNLISAAWLQAARRGEAGSEWHVLVIAMASGGPLEEAAEWLIRRGHTSGADALAGYSAAASALLGEGSIPRPAN